ncbi:MAG: hypothetical protein K1X36_08035 [Pyrinomonadaceae bacterium]|nr:hypothetical protein [Pyrinomonadaceae bacterium]
MTKKRVRWNTPFTDSRFPSATIITGPNEPSYTVEVVVAPSGIDSYPKYVVDFGNVIAYSCMEEMHFPERDILEAECAETDLSAYELLDSTWVESYRKGEYFLFNTDGEESEQLRHYMIVGGDNIVEVITKNTPQIRTVEDAKVEARAYVI